MLVCPQRARCGSRRDRARGRRRRRKRRHAARTVAVAFTWRASGIARGAAATLLLLVGALQMGACASLLLPPVYRELGAMAPAAALALTLWLERALMGADGNGVVTAALVLQTMALALLALFRVDRQARNAALGVPTDSRVLQLEGCAPRVGARARWSAPRWGCSLDQRVSTTPSGARRAITNARAPAFTPSSPARRAASLAAQDTRPRPYAFEAGEWPWPWSSSSTWRRKAKTI